MSKKVIIYDGCDTDSELAEQLKYVASQINSGYTSGVDPAWEIVEDEDE